MRCKMLVFHSGTSLITPKKRRFIHILPSIGSKSLFFPFHYVADQYNFLFIFFSCGFTAPTNAG